VRYVARIGYCYQHRSGHLDRLEHVTVCEILLVAAANAEQHADAAGTGRYLFVESRSWYLKTTVAAGVSRSMIVPVHRRQWIATDGSGRIISQRGNPYAPPADGEAIWHDPYDDDQPEEDEVFGPGGLHLNWSPDSLRSDPAALRSQLTAGQSDTTPVRVLEAVKILYDEQPVIPKVRAAALRVVADLPGLRYDGTSPESRGREGIRVSLSSNGAGSLTRDVMIFDRDSGLLIGSEKVLTSSTSSIGIPIPFVVSRKVYVHSARAENPGPT
jgi:hypothetical protein